MESNSTTHRYVYTKEQLFEIRDAFISSGDCGTLPDARRVLRQLVKCGAVSVAPPPLKSPDLNGMSGVILVIKT